MPGLVVDEELTTVLKKLADYNDVKAVIAPEIDGRVAMNFADMTMDKIIIELSRAFEFDWFYDGRVVYFFPIESIGHQVIPLDDIEIGDVNEVLADLQLVDHRYPIIQSDKADVALVNGPPQYIALVRQTLEAMAKIDEPETDPSNAEESTSSPETPKGCGAPGRLGECLPELHYGYVNE